jgi:hypothetical protein
VGVTTRSRGSDPPCAALTARGVPCARRAFYPVVVEGRTFPMCRLHAAMVRRGSARFVAIRLAAPHRARPPVGAAVRTPPHGRCEARSARGCPCRAWARFRVEVTRLGPRRLCGPHARRVLEHGALPGPSVHEDAEPRTPPPAPAAHRWTAEEEKLLRAGEPAAAVAARLGRSRRTVWQRRWQLRHEGRA